MPTVGMTTGGRDDKTDLFSIGDTGTIFAFLKGTQLGCRYGNENSILVVILLGPGVKAPSAWLFEPLRTMSFIGVCFLLSTPMISVSDV